MILGFPALLFTAQMFFGVDEATHRAQPVKPPLCTQAGDVCVGDDILGTVTKVHDGDGFTVAGHSLRLKNIDAPEVSPPPGVRHTDANRRGQPYGRDSRDTLAGLVLHRSVLATIADIDRNNRPVALLYLDGQPGKTVNAELVSLGAAFTYTEDNDDPFLPLLEADAKLAQRGLWALPEADRLPPWIWRACVSGRAVCLPPKPVSKP